ncbi:MAG TPA: response regulator [Spirochaetota bacterium]|nr:response regulator [Spirochaetota bacterium]HQO39724.1 response regulator [Spirochaetota bacterium]
MYRILIADPSHYREELADLYKSSGYAVDTCDSAFNAISKLKAYDYDLVVSEVELPGDNAFDLYQYIRENFPFIPAIMITDKKIDSFFNMIFTKGIGNVLHKPVPQHELLGLSRKLITKENIFGLQHYLQDMRDLKRIRITRSTQITDAIEMMTEQIEQWGFSIKSKMAFSLILNEMIINAVYHAHGLTSEKLERRPVTLEDGKYVDLFFCRNDDSYAVSVTDYNGLLTSGRILESINAVIEQELLIEKSALTGENIMEHISETGRGIDLVRKLSWEYYFIIKKNTRTDVIIIFNNSAGTTDKERTSLKIIEDKSS